MLEIKTSVKHKDKNTFKSPEENQLPTDKFIKIFQIDIDDSILI